MHVNYNKEEHSLVYEYYRDDLLSLIKNNPNFPLKARKQILREAGKALKKLHARN
jgi:serine/threonine protein kinase